MALETTIVVMFHPIFMTQVDRAYHIQCHYLEISRNVTKKLEVMWTCNSGETNHYCMTVHSCLASDGQGIGQRLIDENGCSLDRYLLDNLEYGTDLTAGQEAHVFKFADKPTMSFSCVIRLELKEEPSRQCKVQFSH
ncbi:hypothetical protein KIN20_024723 [Parelaphostrongylus tenuis]|uniref:ZP domain-containing protein n=1 Tax=Parelaphostrongylus tenuis TaxID=148309 RepID=A0AAD5QW63_PARTN|nr:hypothetical protein KIN20_024723 [Parelaphostrongylus tenuis]